ncbi:MAG: hypothetical protein E2O54_06570, partial [Gammaproteobacteria bacterium]
MADQAEGKAPRFAGKTMSDVAAEDLDYENHVPGITLQQLFDDDLIGPPAAFREESRVSMGSADLSIERYVSRDWHDREVERV